MSEIKSPFLNDEKKKDNTESYGYGNKYRTVDDNEGAHSFVREDAGVLEIKEDGRLLKNIIIAMLILLVLALLALMAYNLFGKPFESPEVDGRNREINLEITDFDMKGNDFQARSVIVE